MTQRLNAFFERAEARWSRLSLRRRAWIAAALLTAAVAILTGALFGMFALRGSSILFRDDDFAQHYPFLIAIGRWWRAFFADPLHAPLFDFSLGFGEDFIGGLNYYGLGDPLTVLAALFAPERTYVCYRLLAALRIELAGLAFLAFCREHRVRWRGALPGAAAYAFTVYMVAWCALKHPMFANPCIHLPLMLLGAERRLKGQSPAALIFAAAWSALCGFYFLYMNSLMLLLYALARHFALNGRDALRRLPGAFGRTLAAYLLGVGMAGAFLLPAALSFLESCRNGMAAGESLLWYSPSTYWAFPISFIASNGWSNAMTVPAAAMLAVLALFASGRENRGLKLAAAAVMLALLIPAVGVVFNGFSYPTDRWKYGGLLLLCYVFARFSGTVEKGGRGRLACGLLLIWCVVLAIRWKRFGEAVPHPLLIALAAALCVLTFIEISLARRLHRGLESAPALKRALSAGLLVLFVGVNILADMLPIGVSLLLDNGATKDPWTRMQECSLAIVSEASSEEKAANVPVTAAAQTPTSEAELATEAASAPAIAAAQAPTSEAELATEASNAPAIAAAQTPTSEAELATEASNAPVIAAQTPTSEAELATEAANAPIIAAQTPTDGAEPATEEANAPVIAAAQTSAGGADSATEEANAPAIVAAQAPAGEASSAEKASNAPVIAAAQTPTSGAELATKAANAPVIAAQTPTSEAELATEASNAPIIAAQTPTGSAELATEAASAPAAAALPYTGRVDLTAEETIGYNAPSVFGVASTAMYDSIRPAATSAFMRALALNTDVTANRTLGLDNRAALEAVWAVQAQTRPAQARSPVPYGFETEKKTPSAALLRNGCALPMAYAMDETLSRAEYDAMPPLEKQWALLSRAVLEPGETSLPGASVESSSVSVPWRAAETDNAALTLSADGGTLAFGPGGGTVALELDGMADSETYLWLRNLRWTGAERDDSTRITVRSEAGASLLTYAHDGYRYALGQRDYLNNVGYSAAPCARIELSCAREGGFAFDSMETLCQPMAGFEAIVAARREGVNCAFDGPNRLAARSEADHPRVIVFAVPALKGWRAEVDGQPARLLAQAGGLCAVEIPAGAHTAAIAYRTPGLTAGLALSGGCLAVSILWLLVRKRRG